MKNIMKYFFYVGIYIFLCFGCVSAIPQQYTSHTVAKGETVFSISQRYGVKVEEIYALNPESREGISEKLQLRIPNKSSISESTIKLKEYKVKRKETLYSISQEFNVSIEEIKKYNKQLYSEELKKGDYLIIPVSLEKKPIIGSIDEGDKKDEPSKHTVKAKETKFGIARKYGITVTQLEKLNPTLAENLQIGSVLSVPENEVIDSAIIEDEKYQFYEVLPKEGFYRLNVKLGLSEEELVVLNPYAAEGLREGMILKIPKKAGVVSSENIKAIDLSKNIKNKSVKNIALLLPFRLYSSDSTKTSTDMLRKDATLRIALDFYSGVVMAAEFAKDKGISINLDVYDTERNITKTESILTNNDFSNIDAVIGPLLQKNVEKAAELLKNTDTPIFSPLSNREITMYPNLFQTVPSQRMLEMRLIEYLYQNSENTNVIIIADAKHEAQKVAIKVALPDAKIVVLKSEKYVEAAQITPFLEAGKNNWILLESESTSFVSSAVRTLAGMQSTNNIRLFTTDNNKAFEFTDVSNQQLSALDFTFPSVSKSKTTNEQTPFFISYKNKYGVFPDKYAIRGFDIGCDVFFRLGYADNLYEATDGTKETEYVENKFRYSKKMNYGYQNEAIYLLKFDKNLEYIVID